MGYQETIFEQALALGGEVADLLRPARELQAQAGRLSDELSSLRRAEEKRRNELVAQVAAGTVAPAEIPAKLTFDWVVDSPASMVIVHANTGIYADASRAARAAVPKIFEALQRRVQGVVAQSVKQSVALPRGVDSEAKAMRARNGDRKALEVWERLRALVDDWCACHELARLLQRCGWLSGPTHPRDTEGALIFQRYLRPLSLPPGYWQQTPAELRLGRAQAAGAGPGLYDWQDAVQRFEHIDRRQRNYASMQVLRTHNWMGNVLAEERGPETVGEFAPASGVS
jgi:hypothetical protein